MHHVKLFGRRLRLLAGLFTVLFYLVNAHGAPTFHINTTQLDLAVPAGVNHLPINVPVVAGSTSLDLTNVTAVSDASWTTPTVDKTNNAIALTFSTTALVAASNTATITVSDGTNSEQFFVKVSVAILNVVGLVDDPVRSRTYAIHQNALNLGTVVIFNPISGTSVGCITVGKKPTDLAVKPDGSELLVICSVSQNITAINPQTQKVSETIALPSYVDWGQSDTSANVEYGPNNIIYYTDGSWAPMLKVLNRQTGSVLQSLTLNSDGYGFGDIVVSPDKKSLYGWAQYGWSAGMAGSSGRKFSINSDGTLTAGDASQVASYPNGMLRDPMDTPALMSRDGSLVFLKQFVFDPASFGNSLKSFPTPVYAISPNGEIVSTSTAIYEYSTGNKLYTLPSTATVQTYTSDYSRLVYFDSTAKQLKTVNLLDTIGAEKLGLQITPANGAIVQAPTKLQWTTVAGVDSYNVYFGTSASAVTAATTASTEYLGQTNGNFFNITGTLTPGTTYYWRVDAVNGTDITPGAVNSFTVALISSSLSSINAITVSAHDCYQVSLSLTSATPGIAWTASSANPWITVNSASGTTPATLQVTLNATGLATGLNQGSVSVSVNGGTFSIPVKLQVDPLALTVIRSDPGSTKLYAISEAADTGGGTSRAYLLEIDSLLKKATRVVPVGTSVTDLAIHHGDNRIYVPNWKPGGLLAVNLTTFLVEKTFATPPFGGVGYSTSDVYRVAAGTTGRMVTEAADQWINISLMNTSTGAVLASSGQRQGGGQFEPTGRYYFHGDSNISSAYLRKLDTSGDVLTQGKSVTLSGLSYYGSRVVVISENGSRIFWNGGVFDQDLAVLTTTDEEINCCSADGRYAFSKTKIYDTQTKQVVAAMPVSTTVSALNAATNRLVVQNGSALAFYNPVGGGLLGDAQAPKDGAIVLPPTQLQWKAMPGITSYRVYLGTSQSEVSAATTSSSLYIGEFTTSSCPLPTALEAGKTYYWRVDLLINGVVAATQMQGFTTSNIAPGATELSGTTVQGHASYQLTTTLSSATAGLSWTASTSDSWISFVNTTGSTPATLQVILDTTNLSPGLKQGTITVTGSGSTFTLPVKLQVDALSVTVMRSDPISAKVYAISEGTVTSGTAPAYLLEIDTAQQKIARVVPVGTSATDLAIHHGDNRIYVPNWKPGGLLAINLTTFLVEKIFATPPFGGVGYSTGDVYRVSAGTAGRLIFEEADQWIDVSLFNTNTGATITKATGSFYAGTAGTSDPTGRYYYRYSSTSQNPLVKFDLAGDVFTQVSTAAVPSGSGSGSRGFILSENGNCLFFSGIVTDSNFNLIWAMGDAIYCASADGKYAFGETKVYDTTQKVQILSMPLSTKISAYNSTSQKLVVQNEAKLLFSPIGSSITFTAPVLSFGSASATSITLNWTDANLEVGFTLQMRKQGAADWTDVTPAITANTITKTITGLTSDTTYEFRIKADSPAAISPWSNVLSAKTDIVYTGAQTRNVTDVATLTTAMKQAVSNPLATFTINLAAGTYTLGANGLPSISSSNTTLKGPTSGNAEIDGSAVSSGIILNITGSNAHIEGIVFLNASKHAVNIQSSASNGYLLDCRFYSATNTAAIYGNGCAGWSVYGNVVEGIAGTSSSAEPAIYFVSWVSNTEIGYNMVLDCDTGIGVGSSSYDYIYGIYVFNNMVADSRATGSFPGAGIAINYVNSGGVYNNTVFQVGANANSIEYKSSSVEVINNLTNKPITGSSSASAVVQTNNASAISTWFKDPAYCDLRLTSAISGVVNAGTAVTGLSYDIEGDKRPEGSAYDIGADEYVVPTSSSSSSGSSGSSSSSSSSSGSSSGPAAPSSGGGGGGAPTTWYFSALLLLVAAKCLRHRTVS